MSIESTLDEFTRKTEKRLLDLEKGLREVELQLKAMMAHPPIHPVVVDRYASQEEAEHIKQRLEELERRVNDAEGPPTEP
jgi:hypothetical protein